MCLSRLACVLGPFQCALPSGKISSAQHIKTVNIGGFGARLKALLDGEVEAASLLPPQIVMAEQLGLRKIIEDRFKTLWWVPDSATPEVVHGYMRALDRAEQALEEYLVEYLPLWTLAVPAEASSVSTLGISANSRPGLERFSSTRHCRAKSSMRCSSVQVERWGLDQYLKDRSPETLSYPTS